MVQGLENGTVKVMDARANEKTMDLDHHRFPVGAIDFLQFLPFLGFNFFSTIFFLTQSRRNALALADFCLGPP
jgi:hypothetical protein